MESEGHTRELLRLSLSAAVPFWIEDLKKKSLSEVMARARVCGQAVAEHGDIIQFKSKRKGETASAFNRLAEGLAVLAFAPGGVKFLDLHFEARHPESGP